MLSNEKLTPALFIEIIVDCILLTMNGWINDAILFPFQLYFSHIRTIGGGWGRAEFETEKLKGMQWNTVYGRKVSVSSRNRT